MSNKLEPRNPDSVTIVFYENDGTHSQLDDADAKQALLQRAEHILRQGGPAQHDADNGTAVGRILIDDDVAFTYNNQPVDTATVAEAIAEAMSDAIRQGIADERAEALAAADERADAAEAAAGNHGIVDGSGPAGR